MPADLPERTDLEGTHITLKPLEETHAAELFPLLSGDSNADLWDYMLGGPFSDSDSAAFDELITNYAKSTDPHFYAICDPKTDKPLGFASLLRIDRTNRVVEIGHLMFSKSLQRTAASTEVVFLLLEYCFDELGYRRVEWKCNNLNAPSKRAAERLGYTFEGVFRQHMIVKGRNRDTAWFSIIDSEWREREKVLVAWLDPENFDEEGRQRKKLEDFRDSKA
ncbi:GNAT family acetyltransferase [Saccharata proteae CBS 121410]|uniref:GNAT family acetyltransferase n=1 Tax=Saccharata proteae CBS 121410 TaxID=1314787 RepID=A0A6A5YBU0_9PEZI|nr:GNAT family acetyltransferase [Saccharata proteae CBS 121410]